MREINNREHSFERKKIRVIISSMARTTDKQSGKTINKCCWFFLLSCVKSMYTTAGACINFKNSKWVIWLEFVTVFHIYFVASSTEWRGGDQCASRWLNKYFVCVQSNQTFGWMKNIWKKTNLNRLKSIILLKREQNSHTRINSSSDSIGRVYSGCHQLITHQKNSERKFNKQKLIRIFVWNSKTRTIFISFSYIQNGEDFCLHLHHTSCAWILKNFSTRFRFHYQKNAIQNNLFVL